MPLRWIVPDGTIRMLEEIQEKKVGNGISPSADSGVIVVTLPSLQPYFTTRYFLVDLDSGEVFASIQQQ